jgi:outer membrane cobalamin receptor
MKRLLFAICLASLAAAPSLAAQARPERADTVRPGQDSVARGPIPLSPVVVTGVVVPTPRARLGFAVSTIGSTQLRAEPAPYTIDALRELPGTFVDEATGPGGPTIVRLRGGEEVFTQILVDGVQVNQNGGFFDFQGLSLSNLDRVEVARGPQSAIYGSSAVSGVLNFLTSRGTPGQPAWSATLEGGRATSEGETGRLTASMAGGTRKVQYSAGAGAVYTRGLFRLPHDAWSRDVSLRLDAAPASPWELTARLRHIATESRLPVRDAGATRVPLDPNAFNARDRTISSFTAALTAGPWTHRVTASVYRDDFLYEDRADNVAATGTYPFFIPDFTFTFTSLLWRTTADYTGSAELEAGGLDARVSYGARWEREELTDRTMGDFGTGTLPLDRNSFAGHVELQIDPVRQVHLLAGSRVERYEGLDASFTPRASAVIEIVPATAALRLAAGVAYKAPNLQQQYLDNPFIISNPNLAPETSTSWEVGAEVRSPDGRGVVSATFFRQHFRDLIRTVQYDASRQINRNLGSSRAQGVEVEGRRTVTAELSLGLAATWLGTEVLDNAGLSATEYPVGEPLPFRPVLTASGYAEWQAGARLSGIIRGTHIGEQTVLTERFSGQRATVEPYTLVGFTLDYRLGSGWSLYGRVENLFDARYETAFDRPGIPLTGALGMRLER